MHLTRPADQTLDVAAVVARAEPRASAPVGDFWFCSVDCHSRWFNEGRLGMS
jgi:hypothetical protein